MRGYRGVGVSEWRGVGLVVNLRNGKEFGMDEWMIGWLVGWLLGNENWIDKVILIVTQSRKRN